MKSFIRQIIQNFKDIYCFIGVHDWSYKVENINIKFPNRNRTINANRNYRICTNCYKCQTNGIGIHRDKWFTENDKEMSHRKDTIRRIKLNKLIKQLS